MTGKFKVFLLVLIIVVIWKCLHFYGAFEYSETNHDTLNDESANVELDLIKVTVYYEALCSDSRNFFIKQLLPTYNDLSEYIQLDLVPYGKAKTIEQNGEITFQCQHAATECLANKIHACSLNYIADAEMQIKYLTCMINDNMLPHEIGEKCAHEFGIEYESIRKCANGEMGSIILKEYGVRTHAVNPAISFIPTIELDGVQKVPLVHILKNLRKELCKLYNPVPKPCL